MSLFVIFFLKKFAKSKNIRTFVMSSDEDDKREIRNA